MLFSIVVLISEMYKYKICALIRFIFSNYYVVVSIPSRHNWDLPVISMDHKRQ